MITRVTVWLAVLTAQVSGSAMKEFAEEFREEEVVVEEEEVTRCGNCVRGCLGFIAGMREVRQPGTGGNPVVAGVEAVVDVLALASERALQQFVYHDMRRAVQRAELRLQQVHSASANDLWAASANTARR